MAANNNIKLHEMNDMVLIANCALCIYSVFWAVPGGKYIYNNHKEKSGAIPKEMVFGAWVTAAVSGFPPVCIAGGIISVELGVMLCQKIYYDRFYDRGQPDTLTMESCSNQQVQHEKTS